MQTVEVALGVRSYRILVGPGLLSDAGRHVSAVLAARRVLLISDDTVARLYLEPVRRSLADAGFTVAGATVPPGETSKSLAQLERLYDACLQAGLERSSLIVALGGGVIGDLAGFVAASYMRGIPFIQMPTTLLAQVDSSIGGKTGINLPGGKNLVGAFHQPSLVLADVSALRTLDPRQFATGMAEVIKHAMIRDAKLFALLEAETARLSERDPAVLEEIVGWNCRIKAAVVAADERESGLRAILNYGHTVGHAVERAAAYGTYTHGEAIALGMSAEADVARRRGNIGQAVLDRQQGLLARFGLPTRFRQPLHIDELLAAMRHDKKIQSGRLRVVLPTTIGDVQIADDVSEDELRAALGDLQP